jgi:hypothetical protein
MGTQDSERRTNRVNVELARARELREVSDTEAKLMAERPFPTELGRDLCG